MGWKIPPKPNHFVTLGIHGYCIVYVHCVIYVCGELHMLGKDSFCIPVYRLVYVHMNTSTICSYIFKNLKRHLYMFVSIHIYFICIIKYVCVHI